MLDDMLLERFMCGINHPGIQKRLLLESDLILEKELEISQGMEVADHSSKVIQSGYLKFTPVQRLQAHTRADAHPKPLRSEGGSCYPCGGQHKSHKCRSRKAQYHICHKKGHIEGHVETKIINEGAEVDNRQ